MTLVVSCQNLIALSGTASQTKWKIEKSLQILRLKNDENQNQQAFPCLFNLTLMTSNKVTPLSKPQNYALYILKTKKNLSSLPFLHQYLKLNNTLSKNITKLPSCLLRAYLDRINPIIQRRF